jgi:hypothetical protein
VNRSSSFAAAALAAVLAACGDPAPPSPDRAATTASATASVTASATAPASASAEAPPASASATEPAPSASASGAPSASASGVASAAPSGSASAAPAAKGFAFPSPKTGILTPAEADKLAPAGGKTRVRVLDAGKEPLAEIAYKPTKGENTPMLVDLVQKVNVVAAGQTGAVVSPPQTLDVEMQTGEVDDSGSQVAMLLKGITLKPVDGIDADTLGQISKLLQGLKGFTLRQRISPRGEVSDSKIEAPPTAPQGAENLITSLSTVLRMMTPRLPDEAVGTGAKWQALSRIDQSGTSVVQLTEYTLKERSGSKVTLDFKARQLAANENIKLPTGAPPGVKTKLAKFSTSASGSLVLDTTQMAPVKGKASLDQKLVVDVTAPGAAGTEKVKTDADMKMTVTFAQKGASAPATTAAPTPSAAPTSTTPKP